MLMNVVPLNLTPVYGDSGIEGEGLGIGYNQTMISYRMEEQVVGVNAVYKYRTAFETQLANEYPGAKIVVYDVHQLVSVAFSSHLHAWFPHSRMGVC